jgi:hypothetical protein
MGTVFFVAMGKACLAACALALGDLDTVPALCQEAQRMAAETADRYAQAVASRVLAEALTRGITPIGANLLRHGLLDLHIFTTNGIAM